MFDDLTLAPTVMQVIDWQGTVLPNISRYNILVPKTRTSLKLVISPTMYYNRIEIVIKRGR
jgi:hypothetical protein